MEHPFADYLFLASLFVPTTGILVGVLYLLVSPQSPSEKPAHAIAAHG